MARGWSSTWRVIISSSVKRRFQSHRWRWPNTDPRYAGSRHVGPLGQMSLLGRALLSIFFVLLLIPPAAPAQAQQEPGPGGQRAIIVRDVVIQGNRRIQEAVILGRIGTKIGSPFTPTRLAEDIRAVFALGYFDDVQLKVEDFEGGVKVTFVVVERPFVRDIQFVGNKKLDAAGLTEKIDLKLGAVYNPVEVTRAAERIREYYEEEGYFEVEVSRDASKRRAGRGGVPCAATEGG